MFIHRLPINNLIKKIIIKLKLAAVNSCMGLSLRTDQYKWRLKNINYYVMVIIYNSGNLIVITLYKFILNANRTYKLVKRSHMFSNSNDYQ